MRNVIIIVLLFTLVVSHRTILQSQVLSQNTNFSVHLPKGLNTENLWIEYEITGSFGGDGGFVRTKSNVRDYEIPTSHEGKPAENLKFIIYSPYYQVKTFNFPVLAEQKRSAEITLKPLGTVPFSGKVLSSNQLNTEKFEIQISYLPDWECGFFERMDCLLGFRQIALVNLAKDGTFRANLPDFARDPIIASFGNGQFYFLAKDQQSGKSFTLKPTKNVVEFNGLASALNYPNNSAFVLELEK